MTRSGGFEVRIKGRRGAKEAPDVSARAREVPTHLRWFPVGTGRDGTGVGERRRYAAA